ncbi:MAG: YdcF family protein [Ruthenibacterium sp.]
MYLITAGLWGYALFYRKIDVFCAHGIGRGLKIIFLCGCLFTVCMVAFIAVQGYADRVDNNEKSVIVLGAGLRGTRVSGILARRLNAAYDYYAENPEVILVVTGGQGAQEAIPEAEAMRAYLVARGVPEEQILVENKSKSTEENFLFAKQLLAKRGIGPEQPMAFATNNFHCYRAQHYAKDAGFTNVNAIPADIGLTSVMPCYLREVFAVLYYWFFRR